MHQQPTYRSSHRMRMRVAAIALCFTGLGSAWAGDVCDLSSGGRIAVGTGFQGGERALSVGYGRRLGQRGSFSLGGAFSGSESSAGVGFGLEL